MFVSESRMFAIHSMVVILCDLYFACVISCVVRSRAADKLRRFCETAMSEKPVRKPVPKWPATPLVRLGFVPKGEIQRSVVEQVQRSDLVAEVGLPADEPITLSLMSVFQIDR